MTRLLSRLAALGILAALVAGPLLLAVLPVAGALHERRERIASLEMQLRAFRERADRAAGPDSVTVDEPAYLQAATPAMAGVGLQELVDAAVTAAGGLLESRRIGEPVPLGEATRLPLDAEIVVPMSGLQGLLYRLETGAPYLFIDSLDIRRDSALGEAGEDPRLAVRLAIHGLLPPAGAD